MGTLPLDSPECARWEIENLSHKLSAKAFSKKLYIVTLLYIHSYEDK